MSHDSSVDFLFITLKNNLKSETNVKYPTKGIFLFVPLLLQIQIQCSVSIEESFLSNFVPPFVFDCDNAATHWSGKEAIYEQKQKARTFIVVKEIHTHTWTDRHTEGRKE